MSFTVPHLSKTKKTFLQSGHFIDEKQVHLSKARYWLIASSTLLGFFSCKEIFIFSGCGSSEPQLLIHCNQIFISFDFFSALLYSHECKTALRFPCWRGRGCTSSAFSFAWQPSCKPKTSVLTWKGQLPRAAPALHRCLNKKGSATIGFAFNVTPALMKRLERGGTRRGPSTRTHKNYFNTDE